jgi:hypothetical protein
MADDKVQVVFSAEMELYHSRHGFGPPNAPKPRSDFRVVEGDKS